MKDRQKKMLRFMLLHEGFLRIEELAEAFSVGKRTVSRDLDVIERWLSFRGGSLERKPNNGTRVISFGKTADELLDIINEPDNYIESLDSSQRKTNILLYLLVNNREIKISAIANTFYISDTSVWGDLNQIESELESSGLRLNRMKGIGIKLSGNESAVRLKFLSLMTESFSSKTIIPYLYNVREDRSTFLEINQLKFMMNKINFENNYSAILEILSDLSGRLGYQFTMSGECLLYFYLHLTVHRIKAGALITDSNFSECSPYFRNLSETVLGKLTSRIFSGSLPEQEYNFLGLLMQVLEPGDINVLNSDKHFNGMITDAVTGFTQKLISEYGILDSRQYYLNDNLESVLKIASASLILRLKNGIPFWHGEWGETSSEKWDRKKKGLILDNLLREFFGLEADSKVIDYILLYFHSMIFTRADLPDKKVRCLICCFEGIGLASYLKSLLTREIDHINIVEATAVFKIRQEYLDANGIELVISTFPISGLDIPVIPVSLPINRETLISSIEKAAGEVMKSSRNMDAPVKFEEFKAESGFPSFSRIVRFINSFRIVEMEESSNFEQIIRKLPRFLKDSVTDCRGLTRDIKKREELGELVVDEWNIRIIHCKSKTVSEPAAGVIRFSKENDKRMIFMFAPDPCPDSERKMLSAITISFLENIEFRTAVLSAGVDKIKKELIKIYQE